MTILSERVSRVALATPSNALKYLTVTTLLMDTVVAAAAVTTGTLSRMHLPIFDPGANPDRIGLWWASIIVVWISSIAFLGGYKRDVFGAGPDEFKRVAHAAVLSAGLISAGAFLAKYPLSRGFFLMAFAVGLPLMLLARFILRRAVHRARSHGSLQLRVLIGGTPDSIDEIAHVLQRESWLGYHPVGALLPVGEVHDGTIRGLPVVGTMEELHWPVLAARADILFLASGAVGSAKELRRISWEMEKEDVDVVVAPSVTEVASERLRIRPVGGLPLVHVDRPRAPAAARWSKRTFDILGSLGLILLFSPVMLIAAIRIKLHDDGPVLFRQTRIGRDRDHFDCLKFRTMVPDAEQLLAELHETYGYDGGLFKLKDDPRITGPGKWLRKHSLDELPQLLNVLRGEMSLVGPRPPLPLEVEEYERDAERRLDVRPGLTGLWQVSGRSDLSWEETIRLDLFYVDNWSMLQDMNILMKTLLVVARPVGAY